MHEDFSWHTCNYYCQNGRHVAVYNNDHPEDDPAFARDRVQQALEVLGRPYTVHRVWPALEMDASSVKTGVVYCGRHRQGIHACGCRLKPVHAFVPYCMEFSVEEKET